MKRKHKIISLMLALILVLSIFSGCGKTEDDETAQEEMGVENGESEEEGKDTGDDDDGVEGEDDVSATG